MAACAATCAATVETDDAADANAAEAADAFATRVDADWPEALLAPSVAALRALPADCKQFLRLGGALSVVFRLVIGRRERATDERMRRPKRYACVRRLQRFQTLLCRAESPLRQLAHETLNDPALPGDVPEEYVDGLAPEHLLRGAMIVENEGVVLFRDVVALCDNQPDGHGGTIDSSHANSDGPATRVGMRASWSRTREALEDALDDAEYELQLLGDLVPRRAPLIDKCRFELQCLRASFED